MPSPVELIVRKRDGGRLSRAELGELVAGFLAGRITDYQMSAWLMAALLRGLDEEETTDLTQAMLRSGGVLGLRSVRRPKIDKHSTGGVGDKVSLCLAPLVAAAGIAAPLLAGRGLGHTGGTLDKLEAIPGYRVVLGARRFESVVRTVGASIMGQTPEIAPADRRLYALRDVTGTVESIPLIVASILSKKLATGSDGLVLDVKAGRGAFMKDLRSAKQLAHALVRTAARAGLRTTALVTSMNVPIGRTIGNALETREAIEVLNDGGPADTRELTLILGVEMLRLAHPKESRRAARQRLERALADGSALERFVKMVAAHGGDTRVVEKPSLLPKARHQLEIRAQRSGVLTAADPLELGLVSVALGAGRARADDKVDPAAGIELLRVVGERVEKGEPIAVLHARTSALTRAVATRAAAVFRVGKSTKREKLVLARVSRDAP
jgi:pyrimidine-nucleoside phosphorylase